MRKYIKVILLFISLITLLTGASQVMFPAFVLKIVGAEISSTAEHFFAIIGMFMFLFGAMMVQVLNNGEDNRVVVLWSGLQKLGASVAVLTGIYKGLFMPLAAGVAGFDLLSGLLFFYYLKTMTNNEGR